MRSLAARAKPKRSETETTAQHDGPCCLLHQFRVGVIAAFAKTAIVISFGMRFDHVRPFAFANSMVKQLVIVTPFA